MRTIPSPLRNRILAYVIFAGAVAAIVLALELTFIRQKLDRAESVRRASLQQLIRVGGAVQEADIPAEKKSAILRGIIDSLGAASARRTVR